MKLKERKSEKKQEEDLNFLRGKFMIAGIIGYTGYTGFELLRILNRHPLINKIYLFSNSYLISMSLWVIIHLQ